MGSYRAVVLGESAPAVLTEVSDDDLPEGDVTVDIAYSSLNYKDGLAVSGKGKIARSVPMTCGIDFAGVVAESTNPGFTVGDEVVATGWGLSETRPGGYTTRQRVPGEVLTTLPKGLTAAQAMAVGTAGLTAMLCVLALEGAGVVPDRGEVVVTGAAGGVGSVAVAVLARLGYSVTASTGREETHDYLRSLGAGSIIDRGELASAGRPLDKERWAGGVDTVGSQTLATVLAQTKYRGAVAACGLAGGNDLPTTVLPFILRGVSLLGIDSVMCPATLRARAWERLGTDLPLDLLDSMTTVEPMTDILALADRILAGQVKGRVVIDTRA
ncbi:MAG TPA: MDR family oxidoreductase [Mycobacteriales bacterium]|nr:MDR family oxidoreductase [Mycobacteriales bacterium]